jgi:hypothetical protein
MYVCAFAATAALGQTADLVAVNGRVFTARVGAPLTQSFAVNDGRFIAVGSSAAIRARIGPDTKIIDLGGLFVVPGLADGHFHNEGGGPGIDLSDFAVLSEDLLTVAEAKIPTVRAMLTYVGGREVFSRRCNEVTRLSSRFNRWATRTPLTMAFPIRIMTGFALDSCTGAVVRTSQGKYL